MSFNNDRLGVKKTRKSIKSNISLDMESSGTQKILQKEEVDEMDFSCRYVFKLAEYMSRPLCIQR